MSLGALGLGHALLLTVPYLLGGVIDAAASRPLLLLPRVALTTAALGAGFASLFWARRRLRVEGVRAQNEAREEALRSVLRAGVPYLRAWRVGELLGAVEQDVGALRMFVTSTAPGLVVTCVTLASAALWLTRIAPALGALLLAPLAASALAWRLLRRSDRDDEVRAHEASTELYRQESELLAGAVTLLAYGADGRALGRLNEASERVARAVERRDERTAFAGPMTGALALAMAVAGLAFTASRLRQGSLTAGGFIAFGAYALRVVGPAQGLPLLVLSWSAARAAAARLARLSKREAAAASLPGASRTIDERNPIHFDDVHYAYRDLETGVQHPVLSGVSFTIEPGARVAVLGPSGSGKSTTGLLALRLLDPDRGTVRLGSTPLSELDADAWRARVGYVDQDVTLFDGTFRANVALGLEPEFVSSPMAQERIERAVRTARVDALLRERELTLDARVYERGGNLSGGQRKRVAVARALVRDPVLLVVDQLASDLEESLNREIFTAIREQYRTAVLYLGHRVPAGFEPTAVYWMEHGTLRPVAHEASAGAP